MSYTVINNISNTTVQSLTQYSTSRQQYNYTIPVEQGKTYYITVFAVNAVGTGTISEHSKIEGQLIFLPQIIIIITCIIMFLVVPSSSSSDLMSQTDDTNPSQTNTYLHTRSSTSDQVSKTGIMMFNDHTVSQFPITIYILSFN